MKPLKYFNLRKAHLAVYPQLGFLPAGFCCGGESSNGLREVDSAAPRSAAPLHESPNGPNSSWPLEVNMEPKQGGPNQKECPGFCGFHACSSNYSPGFSSLAGLNLPVLAPASQKAAARGWTSSFLPVHLLRLRVGFSILWTGQRWSKIRGTMGLLTGLD